MLHKPIHTLLFLLATLALLALMAFVFPKGGIDLGDKMSLKFPTLNSFFEEKKEKTDISKILALVDAEEKDTLVKLNPVIKKAVAKIDSIKGKNLSEVAIDTTIKLLTTIQYKSPAKTSMNNFFYALTNIANEPKSIRILHYGDSQIEGDRISDYIRLKLQTQFGGSGPGLIPLVPITGSVINRISYSNGWDRYGVFSAKDKRVPHNNFGVMAMLFRYANYYSKHDSVSPALAASVKIVTTKNGGALAASYNKLRLFYGGAKSKVLCEFYDGTIFKESDSLLIGGNFNIKEYPVTALNHEFKFSGYDSPDFYAASLEGGKGVMVDNFGLRGSSGTFFNQINYSQLKQFYDYLNVKLIILQFGGNTLPYLKDKEMADKFGGYIKSQIYTLKKLAPQASILLIGPSDMSVKEGTEYVTHPLLEDLRNAIKQAAFDTDCAFFDMYDCMGGKNSMVTWVEKGIAGKDYTHFSPAGARKIATLLYSSLISDYNAYVRSKK